MNNVALNKVYEFSGWITKLVYINILWLSYTVFGGIILGFFPATIAMLFVTKKLILEKNEFNIKNEFTVFFKKEFKKSNKSFYPFIIAGVILIMDIRFISLLNFEYSGILIKSFYLLLFLLIMVLLYSLLVYIDGDVGIKKMIKKAILILLNNPVTNIYILIGLSLLYSLTVNVAGLFFFFSGSVSSWFLCFTEQKIMRKKY
ncbi:YesL family protein [Domibacillus indicus]|uniref:YesL family protein n=1 Tax=Domibacillus indicus TaxID=1437523 RepID=UPI000617D1D0|nr:DUF624 domain-containing protein [Domibacillus indicus]